MVEQGVTKYLNRYYIFYHHAIKQIVSEKMISFLQIE